MRHSDSKFGGGYMACSDNDGGSSIELKNIEERGNPVADNDGGRLISTEAQQQARRTEAGIGVGDHNSKISGGELKKYKGVSRSLRKWIAKIRNGRNDDGTEKRIYLGTFRTAEMAAIVFDTAVIHFRGDSYANRLNFPDNVSHIKNRLEGCSHTEPVHKIKCAARKASKVIVPLISLEIMRQSDSNLGGGDMPCSDNDGSSSIEPKNIEERGKPVADDDGGRLISTEVQQQARKTAAGIVVADHNLKISEGDLKKYKGVSPNRRKWIARVRNGRNDDGTKNRIYLGTFRTAEMAAIVFDTAVIHFRGDSSTNRLNFPDNFSYIKNRLEGCSHTEPVQKIRCVARKAAKVIAPLISLENKDQGMEVSENKDQALEVTAAISAAASSATSALMITFNTGMPDSTRNADFPVVPLKVKQRIKAAARSIGAVSATAHQLPTEIHDDQQETVNNINQQIQPSGTSAAAHSGISSFALMHETLHECSTLSDTIQNAAIPTSNRNSMPSEMDPSLQK